MKSKKIKVLDFVNKYNKEEITIDKILYRNYVPILEKKTVLQAMFDKSIVGEKGNRYVDMFANKINLTIAILVMYTNLDLEDRNNFFKNYDLLCENGLLEKILSLIPEKELEFIYEINKQINDTFINKEKCVSAYVSDLVERFSNIFGMITASSNNALANILNDKEKDILINKLINFKK